MDTRLAGKVDIITPREPAARGAQLSLVFREAGTCRARQIVASRILCCTLDIRRIYCTCMQAQPSYLLALIPVSPFSTHAVLDVHARVSAHGVICDVRKPDVMRIAPAPLYNSFEDVRRFIELLAAELL